MRYLKYVLLLFTACSLQAQNGLAPVNKGITTDVNLVIDPAVSASAQKAVQELGDNVKKGNWGFTLEKMYPRYRKRQEAQHGAAKFKQQIDGAGAQLNQMGVVIQSFVAKRPTGYFQVWPQITAAGKARIAAGGELQDGDTFYNWLVLVPTTQVWKFLDKNAGKPRYARIDSYQVAISRVTAPGEEKWTFIDGNSASTRKLRSFFTSLPFELELPKLDRVEIKK